MSDRASENCGVCGQQVGDRHICNDCLERTKQRPVSITVNEVLTELGLPPGTISLDSANKQSSRPGSVNEVVSSGSSTKYEMSGVLGKGGMGMVFNAKDVNIRREVAFKVMKNSAEGMSEGAVRFVEEAQITGQLEHSNIVPVYELGVDSNNKVFYTMKRITGQTLKDVLKKIQAGDADMIEKYPLTSLMNVFLKICDAMAYAHSRKVIHRDLKPENVMLGDFGEVLVVDWGLAKILGQQEAEDSEDDDLPPIASVRSDQVDDIFATMQGTVMGTPAYMSPEQFLGRTSQVSCQSDIYALGGILYSILTLQSPFAGKDLKAMFMSVLDGKLPPPSEVVGEKRLPHLSRNGVPDGLNSVAMKALHRLREERYKTVESFQHDVKSWLSGFPTKAEEASFIRQISLLVKRRKKEFSLIAAAVVILTALTAGFIVRLNEAKTIAENAQRDEKAAKEQAITAKEQEQAAKERAIAAKEQEEAAKEQAITAKEQEEAAKEQAITAKEQEKAAKEKARKELYSSSLSLANQLYNTFPSQPLSAMRALMACPAELKDLPWELLYYQIKGKGDELVLGDPQWPELFTEALFAPDGKTMLALGRSRDENGDMKNYLNKVTLIDGKATLSKLPIGGEDKYVLAQDPDTGHVIAVNTKNEHIVIFDTRNWKRLGDAATTLELRDLRRRTYVASRDKYGMKIDEQKKERRPFKLTGFDFTENWFAAHNGSSGGIYGLDSNKTKISYDDHIVTCASGPGNSGHSVFFKPLNNSRFPVIVHDKKGNIVVNVVPQAVTTPTNQVSLRYKAAHSSLSNSGHYFAYMRDLTVYIYDNNNKSLHSTVAMKTPLKQNWEPVIRFGKEGHYLLVGNEGETVLYDLLSKRVLWRHDFFVNHAYFHPSGGQNSTHSRLMTLVSENVVYVCQLGTGEIYMTIKKHENRVQAITVSDDAKTLYSVSRKRLVATPLDIPGKDETMLIDNHGRTFVTNPNATDPVEKELKTDLVMRRPTNVRNGSSTFISNADFSWWGTLGGDMASIYGEDNKLKYTHKLPEVWQLTSKSQYGRVATRGGLTASGNYMYISGPLMEATKDNGLKSRGKQLDLINVSDGKVVATSNKVIFTVSQLGQWMDKQDRVFLDGKLIQLEKVVSDEMLDSAANRKIALTHFGEVYVAVYNQGEYTLRKLDDIGNIVCRLPAKPDINEAVGNIAFAADEHLVAVCTQNRRVEVFELPSGKPVGAVETGFGDLQGIGFSEKNRHLITVDAEGNVKLWDFRSGRLLYIRDLDVDLSDKHFSIIMSKDGDSIIIRGDSIPWLWGNFSRDQLHIRLKKMAK